MSEKKVSVEELSQRIDQLLNVLEMISSDLAEISKSLKEGSAPSVAPATAALAGRLRTVEDVRILFSSDLEDMLSFEESEDCIVVRPRGFLGRDKFAKIASIIREAGGEYVSAGKSSYFRLPRGME